MILSHRERFNRLFSGLEVDRVPFIDAMGNCNFRSCIAKWKTEGLEETGSFESIRKKLGFDYVRGSFINVSAFVFPSFDIQVIKRDGNKTFVRNQWGAKEVRLDDSELMPLTLEGPVNSEKSWMDIKDRLVFDLRRFPNDFDALCKKAANLDLPVYAGDLPIGFFGALRELFGFENLLYAFYDMPELVEDILDTLCDLWIAVYSHVLDKVVLDYFFIWEDMCSKNGPLISPDTFEKFLLPRYQKLTQALRNKGCKNFMVDSDGDERPLVPLWMEGGVNIIFPWEAQFGIDIRDVRRTYPNIGLMGGLDKHVLEFDKSAMDKELEKVPFMLDKGRYIPCLDHGVTNQVPYNNYLYFYDKLRELIIKHA